MASSGPDAIADLIRSIKRPEPEPAGLLPLRSLGVRGSFDEPGHGWPSLERVEVVTHIDAAHTGGFAVGADLFSLSFSERIQLTTGDRACGREPLRSARGSPGVPA